MHVYVEVLVQFDDALVEAVLFLHGALTYVKLVLQLYLTLLLVTVAVIIKHTHHLGLSHNLLFPNTHLLGASGVVFAFILLTSFTGFREGEIPLTFILVAVIYLGEQIWTAVTVRDNVSNLTHIIGGLVGGVAGYLLNREKKPEHF